VATDLNKLFDILQSVKGTSGSTRPASSMPYVPYISAAPTPDDSDPNVFGQIAQGGLNAVTGVLRAVTSVGRGNLNMANDIVPYANKTWKLTEDGLTPDELDDYMGNIWNSTWSGLGGFAKGMAYSFMPPGKESAKWLQGVFGGETPVEGAYDLFQTKGYVEATQNLPFLKETTSEDVLFEVPNVIPFDMPFLGIEAGKGFPVTKAGLYSFGLDVGSDPFSFATLGLGGAAKGAAKAIGTISKGQKIKAAAAKEGRAVSTDELKTVVPPKIYDASPERVVPYNVMETSPLLYIGKEMGRGFMDSHRLTAARMKSRSELRAAKRAMSQEVARLADESLDPDFNFASSFEEAKQALTKKLEKAAAESKMSKEETDRLIGQQIGRLEAQIPELIAKAQEKGFTNLSDLKARAEAEGTTLRGKIEAELMDDVARTFADTTPALRRTVSAKYDAEQVEALGKLTRAAADSEDGSIAAAWDSFRQNADETTVQEALKRLLSPLGAHERVKKGEPRTVSFEEREMMKRLSAIQKQKRGAGSEALSKQGKLGIVDKEGLKNFSVGLRKALLGTDTEAAVKEALSGASSLPGEELQRALLSTPGSLRVAGERLEYMGLSGQVKPTAEFQFVQSLRDKKYNPKTFEVGTRPLNDFAVTAEGRVGGTPTLSEVTRLAVKASGKWYPPRLAELLRKAGIKDSELLDGDASRNAQEFIEIAIFRDVEAKTAEAREKILRTRFEQFKLSDLVAKGFEITPSDQQLAIISKRAAALGRQSLRLSDDEIGEMVELAGAAKDAQIDAIQKLQAMRVNPFTEAGRIRTAVLGAKEISAKVKAEKQTRTGYAPTKELGELIEVKKAVEVVRAASKGEGALLGGEALAEKFTEAFFKKLPKDKTSNEIIKLGRELRDIIQESSNLNNPRIRQAFFSRLTNMITTSERSFARGAVTGFDFAFTDVKGRYVQSAVANQMAFLYAGSKSANSIDGGYFARYVDDVLLASRTDLEGGLSAVRTHEEKVAILNSVANGWGGEGISVGALQDALAAAKKRKLGADKLSPADRKTFQGIVDQTYKKYVEDTIAELKEKYIPRILFEEKMEYRVGWIDRLSEEEAKIARQKLANEVIEVPEELVAQAGLRSNKLAYKQIADYLPGARKVEMTKGNPAIGRVADFVARRANAAARDAVEESRAYALLDEIEPAWAKKEALSKLVELGSMPHATGALQSSTMLASILVRTEGSAKLQDRNVAIANKMSGKDADVIAKEAKFFESIVRRLESKFAKEGFRPVGEKMDGKSLDEVLAYENPLAFFSWVRNLNVTDTASREEWARAMQHILNLEVTGKGRAYRNARELLESYRSKGDEVRPATAEEVIRTIAALGGETPAGMKAKGYLNRKGLPQRRTLLKLIDEAEPILDKSELERARGNSWIKEINLVGKEEVQEATDALPDIAMTSQKAYEHLTGLLAELESTGLGWIPTLAMQSVGDSVRQFFVHRAKFFEKTTVDKLGRSIDTYLLPGAKSSKYLKKSWEDYTNYTGFKTMISTIRDMAPTAKKGKLTEDQWVAKMTRLAMSVRDSYLLARGIVPVHTISLTTGEAIPNGLASALGKSGDEVDKLNLTAVALTENDIFDLLPEQDVVDLFFSGRMESMPPTAVLPAARLMVAAMESLPPGSYFNAEQLGYLQQHMFQAMEIGARATSTSEFSKVSWINLNPEAATDAIRVMVSRMLDPDFATAMYERHLANATYAHGILRYEAGQLSEKIMSTWSEIAQSPLSSSSDRIQATIEVMSELNNMLKIGDAGDEAIRVMAFLDAQALIATEVPVQSLFDITTANKIAKAGRVMGEEEKKISNLQKTLRQKRSKDQVNAALVEGMEAREPLLADLYAQKVMTLEENGYRPDIDEQHMLFNDIITEQGKMPWYLNFTDTGLNWFSFDYMKENVAPYMGGFERVAIEGPSEYTNIAVQYAVKWNKVTEATGKNYPEMAFKILQELTDDDLPKIALSADTILKMTSRSVDETVDASDISPLKAAMDHVEFFKNLRNKDGELLLVDEDPMLVQALADLWRFGGHFFGKQGKIVRAGVPAQWLNVNLRQIGSKEVKEALLEDATGGMPNRVKIRDGFGFNESTTTPEELGTQWRDWDISNPYQMLSTLNSAFARSEKLMYEAAYLQKVHGVKVSDFAKPGETAGETAARAKAEGLVKIKGPESLKQQGRELLYFMNTDDYYYYSGVASQIIRASNDMTAPYNDKIEAVTKFASKFDELQNFAKRTMTIFRLGNFIMNFNGGLWTNFYGGVTSPVAYYRSLLTLQHLFPNLRDLPVELSKMEKEIVAYHARRGKEGYTVRPENDPVANKEGMTLVIKGKPVSYTYSDLAELYRKIGGEVPTASSRNLDLLGDYSTAESLDRLTKSGPVRELQRVYESASLGIGRIAARRDDFIRMTMWLDELSKNNWTSLETGAREALKKTDRYHPQVQDLSRINNKVTRQFIMFFTWQAKTLGWIIHDILDKPGRATALLRAQYAAQTQEDQQPEAFGSFDPKGTLLRSYQQNGMNYLTGNGAYSFSLANPVNDLLGADGWLSQISAKSYESPAANLMSSTLGSAKNFLFSSSPLFANFAISWIAGRTSSGQDLMRSGTFDEESFQILQEEVVGQLGLGLPYAALARYFPEQFSRRSWDNETTMSEKDKDTARLLWNWMTGTRSTEYLSYTQRQKAISELKSTLDKVLRNQAGN
jgi:hypothetical protein